MISSSYGRVLTCFYALIEIYNSFAAFSFNTDNDFEILFRSNIYNDEDDVKIQLISSAINSEKSKAFIFYVIETNNGKCVSYDINNNIISDLIIKSEYCICKIYRINVYYFEKMKELFFSCVDGDQLFFMKRIDENFTIIDDNDNDNYNGIQILNCNSFNTFSILYDVEYSSYILYLESVCENDAFDYIIVFNLGNITKSSGLNDENDKLPEIETTIPLIETSQPFIEVSTIISTIITTQPLINLNLL